MPDFIAHCPAETFPPFILKQYCKSFVFIFVLYLSVLLLGLTTTSKLLTDYPTPRRVECTPFYIQMNNNDFCTLTKHAQAIIHAKKKLFGRVWELCKGVESFLFRHFYLLLKIFSGDKHPTFRTYSTSRPIFGLIFYSINT